MIHEVTESLITENTQPATTEPTELNLVLALIAHGIIIFVLASTEIYPMPEKMRFTAEFVAFMAPKKSWPTRDHVQGGFRDRGSKLHTTYFRDITRGEAVTPHYIEIFVEILAPFLDNKWSKTGNRIHDFFKINGWPTPTSRDVDMLFDKLTIRSDDSDLILEGAAASFIEFIRNDKIRHAAARLAISSYVEACNKPEDVAEAVHWMYITVGRHLDSKADIRTAEKLAEEQMGIARSAYEEIAIQWWLFDPWTVIRARGRTKATAATIWLPLTEAAYHDILEGRMRSYECTRDHLQMPSRWLMMENTGTRPAEHSPESGNPTRPLLLSQIAQAGALCQPAIKEKNPQKTTNSQKKNADLPTTLLSFAGTPTNGARLEAYGYEKTGKLMKDMGVEFYELHSDCTSAIGKSVWFLVRTFGEAAEGTPPSRNNT